jgi:hypothetical protein
MTSSQLVMSVKATAKADTQQQRENSIYSPAVASSLTPPAFEQSGLSPTPTALPKHLLMSMKSLQRVASLIANTKVSPAVPLPQR